MGCQCHQKDKIIDKERSNYDIGVHIHAFLGSGDRLILLNGCIVPVGELHRVFFNSAQFCLALDTRKVKSAYPL